MIMKEGLFRLFFVKLVIILTWFQFFLGVLAVIDLKPFVFLLHMICFWAGSYLLYARE